MTNQSVVLNESSLHLQRIYRFCWRGDFSKLCAQAENHGIPKIERRGRQKR